MIGREVQCREKHNSRQQPIRSCVHCNTSIWGVEEEGF